MVRETVLVEIPWLPLRYSGMLVSHLDLELELQSTFRDWPLHPAYSTPGALMSDGVSHRAVLWGLERLGNAKPGNTILNLVIRQVGHNHFRLDMPQDSGKRNPRRQITRALHRGESLDVSYASLMPRAVTPTAVEAWGFRGLTAKGPRSFRWEKVSLVSAAREEPPLWNRFLQVKVRTGALPRKFFLSCLNIDEGRLPSPTDSLKVKIGRFFG